MSIFESGVRDDRLAVGVKRVSSVVDAERARRSVERIGRAHVAGVRAEGRSVFAETLQAIGRLVFPVVLLVTAAAAALIYGNEPAPWFGNLDVGGKPFYTGVLALPLTLFIVELTNRRYGAGYAFMQVLGTVAAIVAATIYINDDLTLLRGAPLPAPRIMVGFGAGLFIAQLISIFVFDRLRGPQWWQAPFFGLLFGGVALAIVAYPAAYLGTDSAWFMPMMSYGGITIAAAIALLIPYWLLRAIVAPLPGFGGY